MNYRFYNVGSSTEELREVALFDLASHVVTDWIPGVPQAAAAGFANILGTMLKSDSAPSPTWCTAPAVADFERQWRMATSWIIGVAFCREVIKGFGYPLWAHVSSFTSGNSRGLAPHWARLPHRECRIKKPDPPNSNFLPDYVVAREDSASSKVVIAFFESKGTAAAIARRGSPPNPWRRQAQNAEFSHQGTPYAPERQVVVATRVNPSAKRIETRPIVVRAWNSGGKSSGLPAPAACELVTSHYYGLCRALGLEGTARALQLAEQIAENSPLRTHLMDLHSEAMELFERERTLRYQTFPLGEGRLGIKIAGFGEEALALLASTDDGREENVRRLLSRVCERQRSMARATHKHFERADGVEVILERE